LPAAAGPITRKVAGAEAAPRLPAGPSTVEPGVTSLASAATSCHACGKSEGKLLLCGRCRNVWFCNRQCQVVARQELGHRGAKCRPVDGVQSSPSSAAPSQPFTPVDMAKLVDSFDDLMAKATWAHMANTQSSFLAAVEKYREAGTVADLIGGARGASDRANAESFMSLCLTRSGDNAAAARAACSALRAARTSGNRTLLVSVLTGCGDEATVTPGEMAIAERESREQERLSGPPPSDAILDLSQEGRISLPTAPAALSRLGLAYFEAAVAICDAALAAPGGRGSPAGGGDWSVPSLFAEACARGSLGISLFNMGTQRQRSFYLMRQAVGLSRQVLWTAAPGHYTLHAQRGLADRLSSLGGALKNRGSKTMAEAEACLREALELGEGLGDVQLTEKTLRYLVNMCGFPHAAVGLAEAEVFRSRLNQLFVQMGRSPETSCSICLEPLAPPAADAAEDAAGGGGSVVQTDLCVRVLNCNHQFHNDCLFTWQRSASTIACPLCKQ